MEIFLNVLHGAYAYLLIFQILVVTLLLLALLWLIVRRTKEAALGGGVGAVAYGSVAGVSELGQPSASAVNAAKAASVAAARDSDASATSSHLQEKVKYLESKLLEYEILQEEISTLSALKVENEELRKKLIAKGMPVDSTENTPEAEGVTMEDPTDPSSVNTAEAPADTDTLDLDSLAVEPGTDTPESAKIDLKAEPLKQNASTPEQAELAELENLLSKIDELTQGSPEPAPAVPAKPLRAK